MVTFMADSAGLGKWRWCCYDGKRLMAKSAHLYSSASNARRAASRFSQTLWWAAEHNEIFID